MYFDTLQEIDFQKIQEEPIAICRTGKYEIKLYHKNSNEFKLKFYEDCYHEPIKIFTANVVITDFLCFKESLKKVISLWMEEKNSDFSFLHYNDKYRVVYLIVEDDCYTKFFSKHYTHFADAKNVYLDKLRDAKTLANYLKMTYENKEVIEQDEATIYMYKTMLCNSLTKRKIDIFVALYDKTNGENYESYLDVYQPSIWHKDETVFY